VELTVNGKPRQAPDGATVSELLAGMDLAGRRVAVERNGRVVPRGEHETTALADGDVLEVVTLVGGG
jgi:sulfur carrier protein